MDSVVMPSADGIARVMITNCLGMSQRAEMGMDVGIATPTCGRPKFNSASLLVQCTTSPRSWDPDVILGDSDQKTVKRLTSKNKVVWRKQQLSLAQATGDHYQLHYHSI